ncbi:MAG: MFS transporter [Candidatus Altiarchaeales archaeon]|nr:MFS transporter [Candidatus Altiarchaeales archaeon]MBD3415916.1 MFS transporter [Candidatus Altiarchaeales archaeon]
MLLHGRLREYRDLFRLGPVLLAWTVGHGAMWFLMPNIVGAIVGDVVLVGVIISLPAVVAMLVDLPIGDLTDRMGSRRLLLSGLFALGVLGASLSYVSNLLGLLAFMVFLGLLYQLVYIPAKAYVMDVSPLGKSSEYLGFEMSFIMLGLALGPIAAGMIISKGLSPNLAGSLLYVFSCFSALTLGVLLFRDCMPHECFTKAIREVLVEDKVFLKELVEYARLKSTGLSILVLTFTFTFYDGMVWTIQPLHYLSFTDSALEGGLILSSFVLPFILFDIPGGRLADRFGRRKILMFGLALGGVSSIAFSMASTVPQLMLSAFIATSGLAFAWPSMEGILTVKTDLGGRGSVIGVWSTARDLGYVLGPICGGLLAKALGLDRVFMVLGVLLLAVMAFTFKIRE